jgi:hypothetical protein
VALLVLVVGAMFWAIIRRSGQGGADEGRRSKPAVNQPGRNVPRTPVPRAP